MNHIDTFIANALSVWSHVTAHELAERAVDAGLYSDEDRDAAFLRWATSDMRRRLKKRGADGVPLAGNLRSKDENGETVHVYKATQFFDDRDYRVVVQDHIAWAKRELATARVYEEDRRKKFGGQQIQIPQLTYEKPDLRAA